MSVAAAESARAWALAMTRQPSVTGSADEAAFGPWLVARLGATAAFRHATIWTFPVQEGDSRLCVAMLLRGRGRRTVILTGHYDTVSIADYGELRPLATKPELLAPALSGRLAQGASSAADLRAKADLDCGEFLPGRGLLDMKAGLAAALAVAERFAAAGSAGNLLFLAVPDEEAASAGARAAAAQLGAIAAAHDLDFAAAINLDAVADDGDGSAGRVVALGTVGKLLPTAFVAGQAAHAAFPLAGINAAALIAAIAMRLEWAAELTDASTAMPGTPPSLLSLRDGKAAYDVTTPATAFATWNVLSFTRTPAAVLDAFDALCGAAVADALAALRQRARRSGLPHGAGDAIAAIPVVRFAELEAELRRADPDAAAAIDRLRQELAHGRLSVPEQCRAVTERLWAASRRTAPAVITGFGSIPYLPTSLSASPAARRLAAAARTAAAATARRHDTAITCVPFFTAISDMSFLGEAEASALEVVAPNTPVWADTIRWPPGGGIGGVPIINAGPWGRDYHTPLERLHTRYGFTVLPDLVAEIVAEVLADGE
jgi:arginine utilization protein RocB